MKYFIITINGALPKDVADKLWEDIVKYDVNLMILDKNSYIFGNAFDSVIDVLLEKASKLGFATELERG